MQNDISPPLPISEYIENINATLKPLSAKIIGEVTKVTRASSGHVYFTLKDNQKEAVLDCVMWKYSYELNGITLEPGMEIIGSGHPNVYPNLGKLSFVTQTIERVGEGALKEAYLKLKQKLTKDGLFEQERKRPLPLLPHSIGVITSRQGAVIHDFTNNIGLHGFDIHFIDSRVEGQECLQDLMQAIHTMKSQNVDVLVIMRGGGSLQSLAAFDNETIVRAIASFPVPVIAAIGHHEDVTLSALAADINVSTPTAAANLLHSQWLKPKEHLTELMYRILSLYQEELRSISVRLDIYTIHDVLLSKFSHALNSTESVISNDEDTIFKTFKFTLDSTESDLGNYEKIISLNNPYNVLQKGYSIIQLGDTLIKSVQQTQIGDSLSVIMHDGTIDTVVSNIKNDE